MDHAVSCRRNLFDVSLEPDVSKTFYETCNRFLSPWFKDSLFHDVMLEANIPTAAILVMCARGVLAVPGAAPIMIPVSPRVVLPVSIRT